MRTEHFKFRVGKKTKQTTWLVKTALLCLILCKSTLF
jgi:hypothetical protein